MIKVGKKRKETERTKFDFKNPIEITNVRVNYIIEPVIVVNINTFDDNLSTINKKKWKKETKRNGVSKFLEMRTPPKKIRPSDVIAGGHRHLRIPIKLCMQKISRLVWLRGACAATADAPPIT